MKIVTDRTFKSIEGILNVMTHIFGIKCMCGMKYLLGLVRGVGTKRQNVSTVKAWAALHTDIPDARVWERRWIKLMKSTNDKLHMDIAQEFYECDLKEIKSTGHSDDVSGPVLICIERNEMIRMPAFLEHYRKYGIKEFAIVDNGSTDGTLEYLLEQSDVRLFTTDRMYTSQRKAGWLDRVSAIYGSNRWYLQMDADELAWYPEMDEVPFDEYVKRLEAQEIWATKAIMLEMYPKGVLGARDDSASFEDSYCYFDGDSDDYEYNPDRNEIRGGFMRRALGEEYALQCKTPLWYQSEGRFGIGSHHIFPLVDDMGSSYSMILQHFKFLPGDEPKIREAVARGNYANGSRLYKKFESFYENGGFSAYFDGSKKWEGTNSTLEFDVIKRLT